MLVTHGPLAIRSDNRLESPPQGAAYTDFDNESGIGDDSAVGSEPEDIGDTPTSVRRVCSYQLFYAYM